MELARFLQFVFCWRSAADCTKLGPLFTTKEGLAAKTPSCLLASRYSCYSNVIVKQRDGNMLENWVRRHQQKHSISFWLCALCRFHFINGKIWGCFCCVNNPQTANISTCVTQWGAKCMFAIAVVPVQAHILAPAASRHALQIIGRMFRMLSTGSYCTLHPCTLPHSKNPQGRLRTQDWETVIKGPPSAWH